MVVSCKWLALFLTGGNRENRVFFSVSSVISCSKQNQLFVKHYTRGARFFFSSSAVALNLRG